MNTKMNHRRPDSLWKIIEAVGTNRFEAKDRPKLSPPPPDLSGDVDILDKSPEQARQTLALLFPNGIPMTAEFYARLTEVDLRLGLADLGHRVIGVLWATAIRELDKAQREELLRAFTLDQQHFFTGLDWLSDMLRRTELPVEFAIEWFPNLVRRMGNDLASGELWKAFSVFIESHASTGVEMLRRMSNPEGDLEIAVAAHLLGVLRTLELPTAIDALFRDVDQRITTDVRENARRVYHRSWLASAQRGRISRTEVGSVVARMESGSPDERDEMFWIVTGILRSSKLPQDCFDFGMGWLQAHTSDDISPAAKFHIIEFASRQPDVGRGIELVLAVQPIQSEHKGVWARAEAFLVRLIRHSTQAFCDCFLEIAKRSARPMLNTMKEPKSFDRLLREMAERDVARMVGQLCLSEDSDCRRLGLFLFDELELNSIPSEILDSLGENRLAAAFFQLRADLVHGVAIGRCLISLIPCMEKATEPLQREFYEELVTQLKNLPGSCRELFECHANKFPILEKAIAQADRYLDALKAIVESGINAMEVPGFRSAARLQSRRFVSQVSQGAEKMSVFAQLFKKVRLLYGKEWRTFHGGELSATSGLREFSHSVEIPRLELIDPEGMNLRRIHALSMMRDVQAPCQDDSR
jgi:hypothetical protein